MAATDMHTLQTIQQQRAAFSYQWVRAMVTGNTPDDKAPERFKAYANSFPAKVQMNGLGQALAFARSKSGTTAEGRAWRHLYQLVSDWLARPEGCFPNQDVLEGIMSSDMQVYRQAQAEVQALMVWVKQFARAEIRGGD
ncbi:type III-B CRISPR module-associated protein Cmr5 [Endozoicomonas sp. ONNA2]|uniref:type III-B CRISPR module-associated protein Cmr5 n=1 Tax=Endozoicomonas sp. ONNA2 TaxID=2828741 RepID=UPI002147950A|nr:type III-B CRISPR module-associated protein Cmr5 [Endozoicomonas sp. ONNA2]